MTSFLGTQEKTYSSISNKVKREKIDTNEIGKVFIEHYYSTFDNNRMQMASLYEDTSMMTFENKKYMGKKQIMNKLCNGIAFQKIKHYPQTLDVQPSGADGLVIMCTGELKVDEEQNRLKYGQMFHILATDDTYQRWILHNDIFRLNYC